jgi:ABC-type Fe3+ transport system permease subunit
LTKHLIARTVLCAVSNILLLVISIHLLNNLSPTFIDIMIGNANNDCYTQEETKVQKMGLEGYGKFAALLFACFVVFCCMVALLLYMIDRRKNYGITLSTAMETRIEEDDKYALSKIGKDSVYSYFVTDKVFGWVAAVATLSVQVVILVVFILASEANLQDDKIDIQFTWKCPPDTDVCAN